MSIEYKKSQENKTSFFTREATASDVEAATLISLWTKNSGTMLPKSISEIVDMFQKGHSVLIYDENKELVSHAAITFIYSDKTIEIGAVVTDINKRKKGAGTEAVKSILKLANAKYPGVTKFALANGASAPIFEKMGARKMSSDELSDEVWGPCATCPKRPIQTAGKPFVCCDVPYDLTHL